MLLLTGIIIVCLITGFLYYRFRANKVADSYFKGGGFKRSRIAWELSLIKDYDLSKGYYNIVAYDQGNVLIREVTKNEITSFNQDYTKTVQPLPIAATIQPSNVFRVTQNAWNRSLFDVQCSNEGKIFSVDLRNNKGVATYDFKRYFEKSIRLSDSTFVCLIEGDKQNIMQPAVFSFGRGRDTIAKKSRLELVSMSEDGTLVRHGGDLIYLNFYNHNYYIIDSSLEKKGIGRTIDTMSALPRTVSLRNNTITKFIRQPQIVNQFCTVVGDSLLVNSRIRADNDDETFRKTNVLDVYDLKQGGLYRGTIYFDKYKGEEMQDLYLQNGKLLLVYPDKLLVYAIKL